MARHEPDQRPCYRGPVDTMLTQAPQRTRAGLDPVSSDPSIIDGSVQVPDQPLDVRWLGRIQYREAWQLQKELVEARVAGRIPDALLLLEHPAVLTLGRGADPSHVRATRAQLAARSIEVISVERGGEATYHGPGQLVVYPILSLRDRGLFIRPLVRVLEAAMADTCHILGVEAGRRDGHPGCWVERDGPRPRKIGALGLRVESGVSYHGVALNINVNLSDFELIDPCGVPGLEPTSIARELGRPNEPPSTGSVRAAAAVFAVALAARLGSRDGTPRQAVEQGERG